MSFSFLLLSVLLLTTLPFSCSVPSVSSLSRVRSRVSSSTDSLQNQVWSPSELRSLESAYALSSTLLENLGRLLRSTSSFSLVSSHDYHNQLKIFYFLQQCLSVNVQSREKNMKLYENCYQFIQKQKEKRGEQNKQSSGEVNEAQASRESDQLRESI
jgi:hypothetical protein